MVETLGEMLSVRAETGHRRRLRTRLIAAAAVAVMLAATLATISSIASADDPAGFTIAGTLVEPYVADGESVGPPIAFAMVGIYYLEAATQN